MSENSQLRELKIEIEQLKLKLKKSEEFFAIVIHELRTPLTTITLALEQIQETASKNNKFYLQTLKDSLKQLVELTERVMKVFQLEQGKIELQLTKVNLNDFLVNYCSARFQALNKEKIVTELVSKLPAKAVFIQADVEYLQLVCENIINNAQRFVPKDGTGHFTIQAELKGQNKVRVNFSDNGCGVLEQNKVAIFERFVSCGVKNTTGLGLYICQKIMELHKGRIWCEDTFGGGATFSLELNCKRS